MNNPECDVCPNDNNTGQMLVEIELWNWLTVAMKCKATRHTDSFIDGKYGYIPSFTTTTRRLS
jgi:hypothetical protein